MDTEVGDGPRRTDNIWRGELGRRRSTSGREKPPQQGQPEWKTGPAVEAAAEAEIVHLAPGF